MESGKGWDRRENRGVGEKMGEKYEDKRGGI